ncbi:MAG TPA: 50S ribosomal protein L25 [Candidatus Acidoferrales bacterium]|jgi:large subunit ribosomal protein L25|nr:50S ribosomal protein L25 [Candidatus Acidoferrales bacterium]
MSTARPTLSATHRSVTGKKVAALRRDGKIPAVVYGREVASDSLTIDAKEFETLRRHAGATTLVDLSIEGKKPTPVLVHSVQTHPVTRHPLHVDLYLVRMTEELTIDVSLVSEGTSPAVVDLGGTLNHALEHVRVKALPSDLPASIHYSIDGLATFEDLIHVSDLAIPAGVTLLTDPGEVVARILPPRVEEVEAPAAEAVEGEAGAEGAEGAAPATEGESSEG